MTRQIYSIDTLAGMFKRGDLSPVDHLEELLTYIDEVNPQTNAFLYIDYQGARKAAKIAEDNFRRGIIKSPLQGITVGVKDVIEVKGMPITLQTELYHQDPLIPQEDAFSIKQLKKAGAIIVGKTNTHEMGMGPTGDVGYGPHAKNAYNLDKVTGGSSSGSASAIASGMVDLAIGTDTGGSIRLPSALSANYGMKPSFGRVSNTGFMPLSYSCDVIGPMTHSAKDNAYVLQALSGYDPNNMYSRGDFSQDIIPRGFINPSEIRIGLALAWLEEPLEKELKNNFKFLVKKLEQMGFQLLDVNELGLIPSREDLDQLRQAHQTVLISEGYHAHQAEIKHPGKINQGIYDRLQTGKTASVDYVDSYQKKHQLISLYNKLYQHVDVFVTPAVMSPACDLYQTHLSVEGDLYTTMKAYTEFTWLDSFTGNPSMSVPTGFTSEGLPLGALINGPMNSEALIYEIALYLEEELSLDLGNDYKRM